MSVLFVEDVSVGDELPALEKHPSTRQLVMYAGASDDYTPIHYDKDLAVEAGLDSVIVHGALKSAFLAQLVTDWIGPSGRLRELSVSYRAFDIPGDTLTCKGRVTGTRVDHGEHVVECDVWLENGKGDTTTPGRAVVSLPSRSSGAG